MKKTLSVLHRLRESLIRAPTKAVNQMQGFLLEFGISLPKGLAVMKRLSSVLAKHELPVRLTVLLQRLHDHLVHLDGQIKELDKELTGQLAVEMGDGQKYGCNRDFAASLGLVPRQYSTGGKSNLLGISKRGDKNLRRLLVQCARAYLQHIERQKGALADWVRSLLTRRHSNVVACALANKLARIAWAIAAHHAQYEAAPDSLSA